MGILSAPATADLVADLIDGRPTAIPIETFSAARFAGAPAPSDRSGRPQDGRGHSRDQPAQVAQVLLGVRARRRRPTRR